jgi:hypothetical protein
MNKKNLKNHKFLPWQWVWEYLVVSFLQKECKIETIFERVLYILLI